VGSGNDRRAEGGIFDAFARQDGGEDGVVSDIEIETPAEGDGRDGIINNPFEDDPAGEPIQPPDGTNGPPPSYDTASDETDRIEPFTPSKAPAAAFLGKGPRKLNKTRILYALFGVFSAFVIFTLFVSPLRGKKKAGKTPKPATTAVVPVDYSALVPKKTSPVPPDPSGDEDDDEIMNALPPVDPEYRYNPPEETPRPAAAGGGGQGVSDRPDTKGDRLQSKTIAGIKGITPTQGQYLSGGRIPSQTDTPAPDAANPYARFGMPSKDEYAAQMLAGYQQNYPAASPGTSYASQNDQGGKMNFYNANRGNAGNGVWLGPATIWQGTIFEAVLTSAVNTDLPGEVTAVISKNIYSSLDGRYLLIPQNSKLYGAYNSSISYSQSRVQVGWHTLIRPDGYAINLGNMAAADARGAAGIKGVINDHLFQYVKALALMSVFNIISSEFENSAGGTDNQYVQNIMANSQSVAAALGSKLIDRAMDVQPAITIKAGLKINIVANTTLALPPLAPYEVTMPYHR
jgi:type IV secretion system protein VirB10